MRCINMRLQSEPGPGDKSRALVMYARSESWFHYHPGVSIFTPPDRQD